MTGNIALVCLSVCLSSMVSFFLGVKYGFDEGYHLGKFKMENMAVAAKVATRIYVRGKGLELVWLHHPASRRGIMDYTQSVN